MQKITMYKKERINIMRLMAIRVRSVRYQLENQSFLKDICYRFRYLQIYIEIMKTTGNKVGGSFQDQSLSFSKKFHTGSAKVIEAPKQDTFFSPSFARFEKSIERKLAHAKKRMRAARNDEQEIIVIGDKHEYQYRQFGDEPKIGFSGVSLLLTTPILLRINLGAGQSQGIPIYQLLFFTTTIAFVFNYLCVLRANQIYPFLPQQSQDNRLKLACLFVVLAVYAVLYLGWNASGGMLLAILWQSLAGRQGWLYLIIFGAIVAGSLTMQWQSFQSYLLTLISSVLFGIASTLLHDMSKVSPYTISHQLSVFLCLGSSILYIFSDVIELSFWQYIVLFVIGLSVYFNLLLWVKLLQKERVSMMMGVTSGIIVISATKFEEISDYVACLTIVLSILVLLKVEYIDRK